MPTLTKTTEDLNPFHIAKEQFNLAADLGAMSAVLRLLFAAPALLYVAVLGIATVLFEMLTQYARYVQLLRWLCLSLLSYVACAFVIDVPWSQVVRALLWPPLSSSPEYVLAATRYFGPEQGPAWISTVRGKPTGRIAITPAWAGILDFQTRFPSALTI